MTKVADVVAWLERYAPVRLAETWDNVGLLWGDPAAPVSRVMTCLTITHESAAEATLMEADLIVSHHPVLFQAVKAVRADRPGMAELWNLARAGISIYSPHTALDNAEQGINEGLARRLGLVDVGPLRPGPGRQEFKVVVFTPDQDREPVLAAAFRAGAGRIGNYTECSFSTSGQGTFFGSDATSPTVGQKGRRETVEEWKVEVISPAERLDAVLEAIRSAHSYEEPAVDVVPLHMVPGATGIGRVGRLPQPGRLEAFAAAVARLLRADGLLYAGEPDQPVQRVAIACGAGDGFVADALRVGADVLLTGETRFHRALEAEARGLGLIAAGHHATERPGVEDLTAALAAEFPGLEVWASRQERDPWRRPG